MCAAARLPGCRRGQQPGTIREAPFAAPGAASEAASAAASHTSRSTSATASVGATLLTPASSQTSSVAERPRPSEARHSSSALAHCNFKYAAVSLFTLRRGGSPVTPARARKVRVSPSGRASTVTPSGSTAGAFARSEKTCSRGVRLGAMTARRCQSASGLLASGAVEFDPYTSYTAVTKSRASDVISHGLPSGPAPSGRTSLLFFGVCKTLHPASHPTASFRRRPRRSRRRLGTASRSLAASGPSAASPRARGKDRSAKRPARPCSSCS